MQFHSTLKLLTGFTFLFILLSGQLFAQFSGGSGEPLDPYQVSSLEELQQVKNYPDKYFIQVNHIDAAATADWNNRLGFEPIGNENYYFSGYYNGNGYEIRNLHVNRPEEEYSGLFGHVQDGTIRGVILKNANILGSNKTGGLAGQIINSLIINSSADGVIEGRTYVGGLAGYNHGEIDNSRVNADIRGRSYVGGISGINRGLIINSSSKGKYTASGNSLGGISGNNYDGTISHCFSEAKISGRRITSLGGLAGSNGGLIVKSFATGEVTGNAYVGGLVGNNNGGNIVFSYSKGKTEGINLVGGLVGVNRNGGKISEAYTISPVKGKFKTGGFAGTNESWIHAGYWATDTTTHNNSTSSGSNTGIIGLTVREMTGAASLQNMELFSFESEWAAQEKETPRLLWTLPYISINRISTNEPLNIGEPVIFQVSLVNTGGVTDSSNVILKNSSGDIIDETSGLVLKPEQESVLFFYWETDVEQTGIYEFSIETKHHSKSITIELKNIPAEVELKTPISLQENVNRSPIFEWKPADRAEFYHLQVANDEAFSSIIFEENHLDSTRFQLPKSLYYLSEYYWRVRGLNEKEAGKWSAPLSFTTIISPPELVELYSPEHESETSSTQPTFTWSSSAKAENYKISLGRDEEFEEVFFDTTISVPDTSFTFERQLQPEKPVYWRVKATNIGGESDWSEFFVFTPLQLRERRSKSLSASLEYSLQQNYPNPFNPVTTIRYSIPEAGKVTIEVLNMLGQTVATLVDDYKSAGWHSVTFDGSELSSGFYIYRIKAKNFTDTKKLSLVK